MAVSFLLVDFENVRELKLSHLPKTWQVRIFIGRSQNSVPFSVAAEAQQLGGRLQWVKIAGEGHNNLDFHLAWYLGRLTKEHPQSHFYILSKDKGFDPLILHLGWHDLQCRRIERIEAITSSPAPASAPAPTAKLAPVAYLAPKANSAPTGDPLFDRARDILTRTRNARPRRRKTLLTLIAAALSKQRPPPWEIERIVAKFFTDGLITEAGNTLAFHF